MTDDTTTDSDSEMFDGNERGRIKHHSKHDRLETVLLVIGISRQRGVDEPFIDEGIEQPVGLLDHYGKHGDFTAVDGIGPKTSERIEAALPLIGEALEVEVPDAPSSDSDSDNDSSGESQETTLADFGV